MRFFLLLLLRLKKFWFILSQSKLLYVFMRFGVMAGVEHKAVLNQPLKTVVDIGANRGQFALAARAISGAKVISFEPQPQAAVIFQKVFADDPVVKLYETAIGNNSGRTLIHLSAHDDSSSLLEIGQTQSDFFPGTHEVGTLEIEVGTLEEYISKDEITRPAMLKLDVQGFEMQALAGCNTLIGNFDYIYCECSFFELYKGQKLAGEVIGFLNALGFGLTGIYNPSYDRDGNCIQADFLFAQQTT